MAATDTRPAPAAEPDAAPETPERGDPVGAALGSADHKVIGRLYILLSLVVLLAVTVAGATLGWERVDQSGFNILHTDTYFQISTLQATALPFLVLVPLLLGIAIYVVPLQVGARTVVYPRATALSFWGYLVGGSMVIASYAIDGGPGGGDAMGVDLWIVSMGLLIASLLLGTVCVLTTIVVNRTTGMTLDRVPLFSWSMLVAGTVWLLTLPVLFAALILAYVDHRYGRVVFSNFAIYDYVHWVLRTPQVYAFAIPAVGIIADVIPVMGRARQAQHKVMMVAIAAFGAMGVGAYMVGAYTLDGDPYAQWMWVGMGIVVVLPLLALIGGWADTLRRGSPRLHASLLFAVLAALLLVVGAVAGAAGVIRPFELAATTWDVGQADLVFFAALMAAIAGLHYWAPKMAGRQLGEGLGRALALVFFAGTLLLGGGNLAAGIPGQVDHLLVAGIEGFDGVVEVSDTVEVANGAAALGATLLLLGAFLLFVNVVASSFGARDEMPGDPWDGHTLEWATSSPPPRDNFEALAMVTSPAPLLDARDGPDDREEEGA